MYLSFHLLVPCEPISNIDSGSVEFVTNGSVSKANVSCQEDYYVPGSSEIECLQNGTWSAPTPSCGNINDNIYSINILFFNGNSKVFGLLLSLFFLS